jgi:RadC-like JAB domain
MARVTGSDLTEVVRERKRSTEIITNSHHLPSPVTAPWRFRKVSFSNLLSTIGRLHRVLHNHPSGDPTLCHADVQMTQQIIAIAQPLGIAVHDHIIVGKEGHASLKGLKLI